MTALRYTLLTDGASDRCLAWIINSQLAAMPHVAARGFIPQVADLRKIASTSRLLHDRISLAIRHFPCDILLIHRDAEDESHEVRVAEIVAAASEMLIPYIPVVPVRMTEAWLLLDDAAIRMAADNPNGKIPLDLPPVSSLERLTDPKTRLFDLLICASEKSGRRKDQFSRDLPRRRQRVAELTRDFSPLHQLPAFQAFHCALKNAVDKWTSPSK